MAAKTCICFLLASLSLAQSPADLFSKAPPVIDDALRARVSRFYQLMTEGKFRQADSLVEEESKYVFFESDKRRCQKTAIVRINYNDAFNTATVVTNCDTEMLLPPMGVTRVTVPLSTYWRISAKDKEWSWYVPERNATETAFGKMKPGPRAADGVAALLQGPSPKDVLGMVIVDKPGLTFSPEGGETQFIAVTNKMPGAVNLGLEPLKADDVKVTLDRSELQGGESAKLTVVYIPATNWQRRRGSTEDVNILVKPTNKVIRVRIVWSVR